MIKGNNANTYARTLINQDIRSKGQEDLNNYGYLWINPGYTFGVQKQIGLHVIRAGKEVARIYIESFT